MAVVSGIAITAPALAADFVAPPGSGRTQPRSEVGTLTCDISPAIGVIIGSQQDVDCVFSPVRGRGPVEHYTGNITKIGVDIGFINGGTVAWAVWAPTVRPEGALKGRYVGASAKCLNRHWRGHQHPDRRLVEDNFAAANFGSGPERPQRSCWPLQAQAELRRLIRPDTIKNRA